MSQDVVHFCKGLQPVSEILARRTVDGISVKVGDTVFRADTYTASVTSCKLYKHHFGMWWERLSVEAYSTEQAAILGAIGNQKKALAKARKEVRHANKAIERLRPCPRITLEGQILR
jgi:uncharacterized protein YukE